MKGIAASFLLVPLLLTGPVVPYGGPTLPITDRFRGYSKRRQRPMVCWRRTAPANFNEYAVLAAWVAGSIGTSSTHRTDSGKPVL
jgi:hypothetical protein